MLVLLLHAGVASSSTKIDWGLSPLSFFSCPFDYCSKGQEEDWAPGAGVHPHLCDAAGEALWALHTCHMAVSDVQASRLPTYSQYMIARQ